MTLNAKTAVKITAFVTGQPRDGAYQPHDRDLVPDGVSVWPDEIDRGDLIGWLQQVEDKVLAEYPAGYVYDHHYDGDFGPVWVKLGAWVWTKRLPEGCETADGLRSGLRDLEMRAPVLSGRGEPTLDEEGSPEFWAVYFEVEEEE